MHSDIDSIHLHILSTSIYKKRDFHRQFQSIIAEAGDPEIGARFRHSLNAMRRLVGLPRWNSMRVTYWPVIAWTQPAPLSHLPHPPCCIWSPPCSIEARTREGSSCIDVWKTERFASKQNIRENMKQSYRFCVVALLNISLTVFDLGWTRCLWICLNSNHFYTANEF